MPPLTNHKSPSLLLALCLLIVVANPLFSQEDTTELEEIIIEEQQDSEDTARATSEVLIGYETDEESEEVTDTVSAVPLTWWFLPMGLLLISLLLGLPSWWSGGSTTRIRIAGVLVLLAFLLFIGLLYIQVRPVGQGDIAAQTRTRTRVGECEVGSSFGVRVLGPRGNDLRGKNKKKILFNQIRPGLRIDSNAKLVVQSQNTAVGPPEGTVTATIYRGPAGQTQFHQIQGHANNEAELKAVLQEPVPPMPAPAGITNTNRQATEIIRVVVHWKPDNQTDECQIEDQLTIVWRYNASPRSSSFEPLHPSKKSKPPRWRSRVRYNPEILEETTGFPGDTNFATQTSVIFAVKDGFSCCDEPNKQYAIVQFVRHRWKIGTGPTRRDQWNLDGPSSQATNHAAGRPYDPTYSRPGSNLQTLGPWSAKGGDAISVADYPGLLGDDHRRFLTQGGLMEWEFWTLLVCQETPPSATQYLSDAKVQAYTHFRILRVYAGGGEDPVVEPYLYKRDRQFFATCTPLSTVLQDKGLTGAFNNPRPHALPLGQ